MLIWLFMYVVVCSNQLDIPQFQNSINFVLTGAFEVFLLAEFEAVHQGCHLYHTPICRERVKVCNWKELVCYLLLVT